MTLSPGQSWGSAGLLPVDAPVVTTDAQLAALFDAADADRPVVAGLAGGDLCAALGGRGDVASRRGSEVTLLPVDLGRVHLGDTTAIMAAHVVARGRLWSGHTGVVMNAERLGDWVVAPRAHPGDGLFDVLEGALGLRERLLARRRARTGEHVPHPAIRQRRSATVTLDFAVPRHVYVDDRHLGRHRSVHVELLPAALSVAV